jgi:hypothetical protein
VAKGLHDMLEPTQPVSGVEGDELLPGMAFMMSRYEDELKKPIRNIVNGQLLRTILIQVSHLKSPSNYALSWPISYPESLVFFICQEVANQMHKPLIQQLLHFHPGLSTFFRKNLMPLHFCKDRK